MSYHAHHTEKEKGARQSMAAANVNLEQKKKASEKSISSQELKPQPYKTSVQKKEAEYQTNIQGQKAFSIDTTRYNKNSADASEGQLHEGKMEPWPVVQQRQATLQTSQAVSNVNAPVQRYVDVAFEEKKWRQADSGEIMVESNGSPGYRSKELYAASSAITRANAELAATESFMSLKEAGEYRGMKKVEPKYVGPGSKDKKFQQYDKVPEKDTPVETEGSGMVMPSDCNKAARVIMGVMNDGVNPVQPEEENAEMGVDNMGAHSRRNFNMAKVGGGVPTLVESGALSSLTDSMIAYMDIVKTRSIYANDLVGPIDRFALRKATIDKARNEASYPVAYRILYDIKTQTPVLYNDFTKWAGLDASALPQVGDALVTYIPDGATGNGVTRNPRVYAAFVKLLMKEQNIEEGVAKQRLQEIGIEENTTYAMVRDILINQGLGNKTFGADIDAKFTQAISDNDLWNKHWGGVVMTDGGDYVTLENDASTDTDLKMGKLNTGWGFAMYGSKKEGQSFHEQMMATGDFGNFASTNRFQKPRTEEQQEKINQVRAKGKSEELIRDTRRLIRKQKGKMGKIESILNKLKPEERAAMLDSYLTDPDLLLETYSRGTEAKIIAFLSEK